MLPALLLVAIAAAALVWLRLTRDRKDRVWMWAWTVPAVAALALVGLIATDLYLQKVVAHLLMPAGLLWTALIVITGAALVARRWRDAAVVGALLALYTLAGNAWLGAWLIGTLERQVLPARRIQELPLFDAVCVLGGGTALQPDGTPQFGSAGDRLGYAARLYLAGKANALVASGLSLPGDDRNLAVETRALWRDFGVQDGAIEVIGKGLVTRDEIALYRDLARARGWRRLGLVTSAWHLPRALALCRAAGLEVTPLPCDARSRGFPPWFLYLIPQDKGFAKVQLGAWEWIGRAVGR